MGKSINQSIDWSSNVELYDAINQSINHLIATMYKKVVVVLGVLSIFDVELGVILRLFFTQTTKNEWLDISKLHTWTPQKEFLMSFGRYCILFW